MKKESEKFIILGGGFLGLSLAYELIKKNKKVEIIEAGRNLGGLAEPFNIDDKLIDKYYHFFYFNDHFNSQNLIEELKLKYKIDWKDVSTQMYVDGKFFSLDSIKELILFLKRDFIRFSFSIIKLKLFKLNKSLEKDSALVWAKKNFGKKFTNKVWLPLLNSKYGKYSSNISALWLATRIKRHLSTKIFHNKKSRLGYLTGTYKFVLVKMETLIKSKNGKIYKNNKVIKLKFGKNSLNQIVTSKKIINCKDKVVISTLPLSDLKNIKKNKINSFKYLDKFKNCCATLVLMKSTQKLNSDYWVTVSDKKIPFDLIINHNEISNDKDYYYYYLSRYHLNKNYFKNKNIFKIFCDGLSKIYESFDRNQIIEYKILSSNSAAPIPFCNFSKKLPKKTTNFLNFFHTGFDFIYPEDRGVGNSIKLAKDLSHHFE
jgi:protoporphyrinogen oxidase